MNKWELLNKIKETYSPALHTVIAESIRKNNPKLIIIASDLKS